MIRDEGCLIYPCPSVVYKDDAGTLKLIFA
jgi:hypothetical protein